MVARSRLQRPVSSFADPRSAACTTDTIASPPEIARMGFLGRTGVVTYADRNGRYGKLVEIDHGQDFVTRYAHLADISVTVGQEVERGTRVGTVGSTGRSTAPHLHCELRIGGQPSDPQNYIEVGNHVFKRHTEGRAG